MLQLINAVKAVVAPAFTNLELGLKLTGHALTLFVGSGVGSEHFDAVLVLLCLTCCALLHLEKHGDVISMCV